MASPAITRPLDRGGWSPAASGSAPSTNRRWSLRRTHLVVGGGAAAIALWLGLTAPSVSPVAPVPAPVSVVTIAGTTAPTSAGTVPTGTVPDPQVPGAVDGPRRGRGR